MLLNFYFGDPMKAITLVLLLSLSLASMAWANGEVRATLSNDGKQLNITGKNLPGGGTIAFIMKTQSASHTFAPKSDPNKKSFDILPNGTFSYTLSPNFLELGGRLDIVVVANGSKPEIYSVDIPCDQNQWSSTNLNGFPLQARSYSNLRTPGACSLVGSSGTGSGQTVSNDPSCKVDISPAGDKGDRVQVSIGCKPAPGKGLTGLRVRVYGSANMNSEFIENPNFNATKESSIVGFPRDIVRDPSHNQNIRVELMDNDTRINLKDTNVIIAREKTHNFAPTGTIMYAKDTPNTNTNVPFDDTPSAVSDSNKGGDLRWDINILAQVADGDVHREDNETPITVQLFALGAGGQPTGSALQSRYANTGDTVTFSLTHKWTSSMFNKDTSAAAHKHAGDLNPGENWFVVRVCDAYDDQCKNSTTLYPFIKVNIPNDPTQGH
jgi:hypothetical protein